MKQIIDIYTDPKFSKYYDFVAPRPQPSDFAVKYFNSAEELFFIDVGANDGITWSNSLTLEINYNWKGICIEPHPVAFKKLIENRKCMCIDTAISDKNDETSFMVIEGKAEMLSGLLKDYCAQHKERIIQETTNNGDNVYKKTVQTKTLQTIFTDNDINKVDYLSVDTEGSELSIISGIDFSKVNIELISLESNYDITPINEFMAQRGYDFIEKICADAFYKKKR